MNRVDSKNLLAGTAIAGACPLLPEAGSLLTGLAMATGFLSVCVLSALSVSLCRRYVSPDLSLPLILIISVSWVIVLDRLMLAYCYELRLVLGIYVPILAMNSLLLMLVQGTALKCSPLDTLRLIMPPVLLIGLLVVITGGLRELLGHGGLLVDAHLLPGVSFNGWRAGNSAFTLLLMPAGAFFGFAFLLAAVRVFFLRRENEVLVEQG